MNLVTTTYPPIKNGTHVRALVRRVGTGDYTGDAIAARVRHDGEVGVVREHHDSHGLCYGVEFEGGRAFYDPEELEVVPCA